MTSLRTFSVWFFLFLFFASLPKTTFAHFPNPSQIFRFQPHRARERPAFVMKAFGVSLQTETKTRVPIEISWYDPGEYEITVGPLPKFLLHSEYPKPISWTLFRKNKECSIRFDSQFYSCSTPSFWAHLELMGQPELAVKTVADAGFLAPDEIEFVETNGRNLGAFPNFERQPPGPQGPVPLGLSNVSESKKRVRLAQGYNGETPVAVLEIRGPTFVDGKNPEDSFPILHVDPTFLAPLFARWKSGDQVFVIRSVADAEIRRKQTRFTHLVSKEVEVQEGPNLLASFSRQLELTYPSPKGKLNFPKNQKSDFKNFAQVLTPEGQAFLNAFLLTH